MQSESVKKQIKALWAILAMLTMWTTIHTVKLNTIVPDFNSVNKTLNILIEKVNAIEGKDILEETYEELYREQLNYENELKERADKRDLIVSNDKYTEKVTFSGLTSFEEAFKEVRDLYGSGAFFYWEGKEYTTFYKEELANNND